MFIIFGIAYLLFIFGIAFTSFFIVTRLQKYSINPKFTHPLIIMYIVTTIVLAIVNIILFVSIPFDTLFPAQTNLYY